jgi:type I restriction enzyme R subunit
MANSYTEELLVEQPAMELFAELGWRTVSALDENLGFNGLLGRETKSEVVLVTRLRRALQQLNPALPVDPINSAVIEFARDRSAMSLAAANREVWELLPDGATVSADQERSRLRGAGRLR